MNRFDGITTTLGGFWHYCWSLFVAGRGGGDGSPTPSSAKAITACSLAGVTGTIHETAKTISVTMPSGTNVTALVAKFTTTGARVKVGTTVHTGAEQFFRLTQKYFALCALAHGTMWTEVK